jgi:voltage-gated potassium channel Kch
VETTRAHRPWRRLWRKRLRPGWRLLQPYALLIGAALVIVLGTIGYLRVDRLSYDLPDALYRSITLFGLNGSIDGGVPLELQIARFLAPVIVGYAAIKGLLALFRDQTQLFYIRLFMRRHVVVAGLGDLGLPLARMFNEFEPVVAIERDMGSPTLPACRERGISVLKRDATDVRTLEGARVARARYLFIACGDDRVDLDVLAAAQAANSERIAGCLTAFVSLDDAQLWRALAARTLASPDQSGGFRREFFHVHDIAADMMVELHPPFRGHARAPHALLVGLDGIGESFVLKAARLWQIARRDRHSLMRITLVAQDARERCAQLLDRYPRLSSVCEVVALDLAVDSADVQEGSFLSVLDGPPLSRVYVCLTGEADALKTALALAARPVAQGVDVIIAVPGTTDGAAAPPPVLPRNVQEFSVIGSALAPARLLEGVNETLARAMHNAYIRFEIAKGLTPADNELLVPWDELTARVSDPGKVEDARDASRGFVDGIGTKLAGVGCTVVPAPLIDPHSTLVEFSDEEVEFLAMEEHGRWCDHKVTEGWRYGERKDARGRTHPCLVPWSELPEDEREKDREFVRTIPARLAQAEFEVLRVSDAPVTASASEALGRAPVASR